MGDARAHYQQAQQNLRDLYEECQKLRRKHGVMAGMLRRVEPTLKAMRGNNLELDFRTTDEHLHIRAKRLINGAWLVADRRIRWSDEPIMFAAQFIDTTWGVIRQVNEHKGKTDD